MTKPLPILITVPHAGIKVPEMLKSLTGLSKKQIILDGDLGASEIYNFKTAVKYFIQAEIARTFVDLNRAPHDYSPDGVVKTHTCLMEEIYHRPLSKQEIIKLLERYYYPWHKRLARTSLSNEILFGIDCHTMAETAPPISSEPGKQRPWICLSNHNTTCPCDWLERLAHAFEDHLAPGTVQINNPFKGGYIIQKHSPALNWVQLEISRKAFADNREKKDIVFDVLTGFVERFNLKSPD